MATRAKVKIDEAIIDTFTVAATKTATLGKRVKFASADDQIQDCVAGEDGIGIAMSSAAAGAKVGVLLDGHAMVKVLVGTGGATRGKPAIAVNDGLTDALGANAKDTQYIAGRFMQSGVAGDYVGLLVGSQSGGRSPYSAAQFRVRNIVNGNVADLTAYTVAAGAATNDNVLNVAGDIVALIAQTTASQNGLYKVGTVASGTAPLTRIGELAAAQSFLIGSIMFQVAEGDVYKHTEWKNTAAGAIATDDPLFFPRSVTIPVVLVAGKLVVTSIPILSASKSNFLSSRTTANTCSLTDGGYHPLSITAGKLGTASVQVTACVLAGTINVADVSTLNFTVINY